MAEGEPASRIPMVGNGLGQTSVRYVRMKACEWAWAWTCAYISSGSAKHARQRHPTTRPLSTRQHSRPSHPHVADGRRRLAGLELHMVHRLCQAEPSGHIGGSRQLPCSRIRSCDCEQAAAECAGAPLQSCQQLQLVLQHLRWTGLWSLGVVKLLKARERVGQQARNLRGWGREGAAGWRGEACVGSYPRVPVVAPALRPTAVCTHGCSAIPQAVTHTMQLTATAFSTYPVCGRGLADGRVGRWTAAIGLAAKPSACWRP